MATRIIEEIHLAGMPISEGIAVGTLFFMKPHDEFAVPEFPIHFSEVNKEIKRYRKALSSSRKELERLQLFLKKEGADEAVSIIDAHIQMLDDPFLTTGIEEKITQMLENPESVFHKVIRDYKANFQRIQEPEMKQRLLDVQDVSSRILKNLHPVVGTKETIPLESILCTYELVPSQAAEANPGNIRAFVTEIGGVTSHGALIARSKGIPYLSNISMADLKEEGKVNAIVDGTNGILILHPSQESIEKYLVKQEERSYYFSTEEDLPALPKTVDGISVDVQANLESLSDIDLLKEYNVRTIGLVRSEFIYLRKSIESFHEEEQFHLYKKLMLMSSGMDVTFRVFDMGSDKKFFRAGPFEPNPALGCRSIRFLLEHPQLFSSQIRAILRAAIFGKVKILLPLVADLEELRMAKDFIYCEKKKLIREGFTIPTSLQIGCMVEVPAFVIMCDHIIKECDFLSIGTNDLIQYTLVADRSNSKTSHRYGPLHPSIIRLIKHVADEAHRKGVPISICGEIASDVRYTKLLIGLGIRSLSCAPRFIPLLKRTIAKIDAQSAKTLADAILLLATSEEVQSYLA